MVNGETIFFDTNYNHYLIQYIEKLGNDYSDNQNIYFTVIDEKNAIMSVPKSINGLIIRKNMPFITYINRPGLYTLHEDISPIESANIQTLQIKGAPLNLTGLGVVVAIIDTGIDYTNPIFINSKGESRIKLLWDQTLKKKAKNNKLEDFTPFGEIFSKDEINSALKVKSQGGDPYSVVYSKDDIGHGTKMASIIGGSYKDKSLDSVVPEVEFIIIKLMEDVTYKFIYEKTKVEVIYFSPEGFSGEQLILVLMKDIQPGTWIFRLYGRQILDGKFNVWIPQNGIAKDETRFISPDPYGTVTSPGLSTYIITVANYNQNNNNIVNSSGMASLKDSINKIDLAAGGINMLAINNNGEKQLVSGTSVSSAVVAGVCAMILQWGIVDGNDPLMYSKKIKAYLARGVSKRSGDIYPNVEWGYGMLNVAELFRNMY